MYARTRDMKCHGERVISFNDHWEMTCNNEATHYYFFDGGDQYILTARCEKCAWSDIYEISEEEFICTQVIKS